MKPIWLKYIIFRANIKFFLLHLAMLLIVGKMSFSQDWGINPLYPANNNHQLEEIIVYTTSLTTMDYPESIVYPIPCIIYGGIHGMGFCILFLKN